MNIRWYRFNKYNVKEEYNKGSVNDHIWEKEELPESWNVVMICPIHKKYDIQICNNDRRIVLLNVAYKVLSYCILDKI